MVNGNVQFQQDLPGHSAPKIEVGLSEATSNLESRDVKVEEKAAGRSHPESKQLIEKLQ